MKRLPFAAVLVLVTALLGGPPPASAATSPAHPWDFDGNGHPDLVVGAPALRVTTVARTGGVVVLPASAAGLSLREKVVSQSSRGVPGASETGDRFGYVVASADFDRDGYADLAVGQPGERAGTLVDAGAVTVVHGSARGLDTNRSTGFGAPSGPAAGGFFGEGLTAGDFDDDGYPDLAVGEPGAPTGPDSSGTVTILRGGPAGVTATGAVELDQQQGPPQDWQPVLRFGSVLTAADLDGDGVTDLVAGSGGGPGLPGSVTVCRGSADDGPTACSRLVFALGLPDMTLAVGDVTGTGRPEIVASSARGIGQGGGFMIVELAEGTPLAVRDLLQADQSSPGIPGSAEPGDGFGRSLAVGDVDRDGYDDLALGSDGEDGSGRVTIVHGARTGWRTSGNQVYDQDTAGVPGAAENLDRFGSSVTLLDHDGDGRLDLTVGAAGENRGAGAITTLRGSGRGFTTTGSRTFGLATLGYAYPAGASFGATLGR